MRVLKQYRFATPKYASQLYGAGYRVAEGSDSCQGRGFIQRRKQCQQVQEK